jgi:hypothetical protein
MKKMKRRHWALCVSALVLLSLPSIYLPQPAFATVPVVQNVRAYDVGGSTYLNITVLHLPENQTDYVDKIEVILGSNTTDLTIGLQVPGLDRTFTVTYDVGPVTGTPTATVRAHCVVDGWSATNWTGVVPEFPTAPLTFLLVVLISLIVIVLKKKMIVFDRESSARAST